MPFTNIRFEELPIIFYFRRFSLSKPSFKTASKGNRDLERQVASRRFPYRAVLSKSSGDPGLVEGLGRVVAAERRRARDELAELRAEIAEMRREMVALGDRVAALEASEANRSIRWVA